MACLRIECSAPQKLAAEKLAAGTLGAPESEPPADKRSVDELLDFIHADRCGRNSLPQ